MRTICIHGSAEVGVFIFLLVFRPAKMLQNEGEKKEEEQA